jgi:hypothetical protein
MSTCNFSQPNLSRIYSIGDGCQDQEELIMEYENALSSIQTIPGFYELDKWSRGNRDYKIVGCFSFQYYDREDKNWEEVNINVTYENGYYQGGMFDIEDNPLNYIKAGKTLQRKIGAKIRHLERVLEKVTTPMVRAALFSNGEAIYRLASSK